MSTAVRSGRRDAALVFAVALGLRLATAWLAAGRFPPADDGVYYAKIAERIAAGAGYTWLWPDGAVTYAAHYPIGYPAILGAIDVVFGHHLGAWMAMSAVLGALAALASHQLALRAASPRGALIAGLLVAVHPGLVAYTPAVMTEGVTAALLILAAWATAVARDRRSMSLWWLVLPGLVLGIATLVRPQSLLLAPVFGWCAVSSSAGLRARFAAAAIATVTTLAVCAPWTARNCARMGRCSLVSMNGGWNLLIGADRASTGAWSPVEVPAACATVWDEAAKDACFGREARRFIADHPAAWLSLVPSKLGATFNYAGAGGYYLHASNPAAFPYSAKVTLGVIETAFERIVLVLALVALARPRVVRGRLARGLVAAVGVAFALVTHAWVAYVALAALGVMRGAALWRGSTLVASTVAVVASTLAVHAVFFGAGRYSLVVFPFVTSLVALLWAREVFDKGPKVSAS